VRFFALGFLLEAVAFALGFCFWPLGFWAFGFWLLEEGRLFDVGGFGREKIAKGKRIAEGKKIAEGELLKGIC
jgi:hypothetical protein